MSKIIILAIANGPPVHDAHRIAQSQTWAKEDTADIKIRWLKSNSNTNLGGLDDRILWLNSSPEFAGILQNSVLGLQWILDNEIFDWIVFTNTSTYFRVNNLGKLLKKMPTDRPIVAGNLQPYYPINDKWGRKRTYLQGSGIYINYEAALKIVNLNFLNFGDMPADLALTDYIKMHEIEIKKIPVCNLYIHHVLFSSSQIRVKSREYPNLPVLRMYRIHRIYSAHFALVKIYYWIKLELLELTVVNKSPMNVTKYTARLIRYFFRSKDIK
jgi:hypothetical protein